MTTHRRANPPAPALAGSVMAGRAIGASWCGPIASASLDGQAGTSARWWSQRRVSLTQTVKHRDEHGRLLSVEIRAALGAGMEPAGHGACRTTQRGLARSAQCPHPQDARLRQTRCHLRCAAWACSSSITTSSRAHRALRLPLADGVRRYHHRSPAMALGLTDHRWSFLELLTTRVPITP